MTPHLEYQCLVSTLLCKEFKFLGAAYIFSIDIVFRLAFFPNLYTKFDPTRARLSSSSRKSHNTTRLRLMALVLHRFYVLNKPDLWWQYNIMPIFTQIYTQIDIQMYAHAYIPTNSNLASSLLRPRDYSRIACHLVHVDLKHLYCEHSIDYVLNLARTGLVQTVQVCRGNKQLDLLDATLLLKRVGNLMEMMLVQ